LSVTANKTIYFAGELITLIVTGDDQGASSYTVFGRLQYDGSLVDNWTRAQTTLQGNSSWSKGVLNQGDTNAAGPTTAFSYAFSQLAGLVAQTATNLPGAFSTVTLLAQAGGVLNVRWDAAGGPSTLDFFGLT